MVGPAIVSGARRRVSFLSYHARPGVVRFALVAALIAVSVHMGGCARRGGTGGLDDAGAGGRAGLGDEAMAPGSSLERARRGLPPEEDGILKDVHFDLDSYTLAPEARSVLEQNANWLKANPRANVELEGHADERGTVEYNLALGARRAQTVRDYLTVIGVAAGRISTISYGEELPVCRDQTDQCWRRNRRVHFVVLTR